MTERKKERIHTEMDEMTAKFHELIDSGNAVVKAVLTVWLEALEAKANKPSNASTSTPGECLMTADEVAEYLRLTKQTIYAWVSDESIPHLKLNGEIRFRRAALDAWMEPNSKEIEKEREKTRARGKVKPLFPAANR